jgi:hypothetical protein
MYQSLLSTNLNRSGTLALPQSRGIGKVSVESADRQMEQCRDTRRINSVLSGNLPCKPAHKCDGLRELESVHIV